MKLNKKDLQNNLSGENSTITIIEGKGSVAHILDDVYNTLKDTGGEVLISGVDEKNFIDADKKKILEHINRLSKQSISERILARHGDSYFFAGEFITYRWVPENYFSPTPLYIYSDKIAMIVWGENEQVIIIKNSELANAYRKQFLFIWQHAHVPPIKSNHPNERTRLEQSLIKRFGGKINSITEKDNKLFQTFFDKAKNNSYADNFYYLCQAVNGNGHKNLGLKFFDSKTLATLGIFNRYSLGGGWHFHIVHPLGEFNELEILKLSKSMLEISGNPVYIKKVNDEQRQQLLNIGFSSIEEYPWHAQAMEEDDTFPEQIVNIEQALERLHLAKGDLAEKYKRFITKNGHDLNFKNLSPENTHDAKLIVNKFFEYLDVKNLHISKESDYDNIISAPPLGKNGVDYFNQIIYLGQKPVAWFAVGKNSETTASLYANITLHQEHTYLSEFLLGYVCKVLYQAGVKTLNLGGSETGGLFQFKEKLQPVEYKKMHWVVYKK
jgi:hypothetical protein